MKKILSLLIVLAAFFSLSACSGGIKWGEAKVYINECFDAVENKDYELAALYLHPEYPLDLAKFFEWLENEKIASLEAPIDTAELARKNDSIQSTVPMPQQEKKRWIPNSNKTVWLSLVIPGAGQIYNRKYWKLPIIYGGFVGCAYALTWNGQMYKDYSQAYQDIMSNNPNNNSYEDFLPPGVDVNDRLEYYQDLFRRRKDLYRRQRDLSIFAFIGVYLLSVIDAYVDAELSDFDISKDLTMTWQPTVFNDAFRGRPQGIGVQCSINF